jgi:excisionase family DNA binding protein
MVDRSDRRSNITTLASRRRSSSRLNDGDGPATLDGLPLMLTVDEAARVLRISRTTAYKLVALHDRTAGRSGLPNVRLGSRRMIRRVDLAAIVGMPPTAG